MFRRMDGLSELFIVIAMSGIEPIITGHFVVSLRDVLNKQRDKIQSRHGFPDKDIIFVPVVMECNIFAVI